ncbi:ankyrin repeat domain-containing protein [Methylobacterium sp.]|uniref:ankyrin repeat domain-containing protein n=1 Tax=Methylobacterium sp. TaxID=409 RepID=UPI003B02B6D9
MYDQLARLAYSGQWKNVIALLNKQPDLVNAASTGKGYTPLHQAAWHGVDLSVIGALLALGSDRRLLTKEGQTARDIARSRHPGREDLHYILSASTLSPAQLLRKLIAETPGLFSDYDGNRIICDRLITCLGETWDEDNASVAGDAARALPIDLDVRLEAAIQAITGLLLPPHGTARFVPANHFHFSAGANFVRNTLLPPLSDLASRAALIPLEPHWAVLADLFEPAPEQWGLRGDLFLWMELRQVLSHCELSDLPDRDPGCGVGDRLASAVASLIGAKVGERRDVYVRRYARGGMSSGRVSCDYWHQTVIPLFVRRAGWLRQSWVGLGPNAA